MALLDYVDPKTAPKRVRTLFDAERERYGRPSLFGRIMANNPDVYVARSEYATRLVDDGNVPSSLIELAYVAVSAANECEYCVESHRDALIEQVGLSEDRVEAVVQGNDEALDHRERAVVSFARQVGTDPKRVNDGDLSTLRDAGFDEADCIELLTACSAAVAANTIADALNVHTQDRTVLDGM